MHKLLLSLVFFPSIILAAVPEKESCFDNLDSYKEVQTEMPPILSHLPLYVGGKAFGMIAGVGSIEFAKGGALRFYFNAIQEFNEPLNSQVTICVFGNKLTVKFESAKAKPEVAKIIDEKRINVRNKLDLAVVSLPEFNSMKNVVAEKVASSKSKAGVNNAN
ncbi:MAG: hypothetical protein H7061_00555 [Bdellovibrionaceae bacterium]|nr:hypothetical protein [Bdellovibrio sp.]